MNRRCNEGQTFLQQRDISLVALHTQISLKVRPSRSLLQHGSMTELERASELSHLTRPSTTSIIEAGDNVIGIVLTLFRTTRYQGIHNPHPRRVTIPPRMTSVFRQSSGVRTPIPNPATPHQDTSPTVHQHHQLFRR